MDPEKALYLGQLRGIGITALLLIALIVYIKVKARPNNKQKANDKIDRRSAG